MYENVKRATERLDSNRYRQIVYATVDRYAEQRLSRKGA
jgi:hypothetical protein